MQRMKKIPALIIAAFLCLLTVAGCGGGSSSNSSTTSSGSWAALSISGGNRQATVSWVATPATTGTGSSTPTPTYNLYWSNSPGLTGTVSKVTNVTSPYVHTGLTNGTSYYYAVTRVVSGTEGPKSLVVGVLPSTAIPLAPTGITITSQNSGVLLTIDRSADLPLTTYNLYYTSNPVAGPVVDPTVTGSEIINAFGSGSTFQHTGLTNTSQMYNYRISAVVAGVESPLSNVVSAVPAPDLNAVSFGTGSPTATLGAPNLVTAVAGNKSVTLSWNMPTKQVPTTFVTQPMAVISGKIAAATPVITAYNVYWSTAPLTGTQPAVTPVQVLVNSKTKLPFSFTHNANLANGTPYYYEITALSNADANGNLLTDAKGNLLPTFESPIGGQISVVPEVPSLNAPSGFTATSGSQQVTLTWTQSGNAAVTYNVYEFDTATASGTLPVIPNSFTLIGSTSAGPFVHSALGINRTYYYFVTAVTGSGNESVPTPVSAVSM